MEKIAIIELNEVALKLSIFKVNEGKEKLCMVSEQDFQIGREISNDELLSPKTKTDILEILKIYRKLIIQYGATKILCVADNVLMKARNYRGFFDEVYNNTGLNFAILSDEDHIKSLFNSVVNSIDNAKGVFVYVGAYSTFIVKYNRRAILGTKILPIGKNDDDGNVQDLNEVISIVENELKNIDAKELIDEECKVVGVGNAFISLGRISKKIERYSLDLDNNYTFTKESAIKTFDFIKSLDREKIRKIKGVGNEDADKIAKSSAIVKAIFESLQLDEITISDASLRKGVLFQNVLSGAQEKFNDLLANSLDNYFEFAKDEFSINVDVYNMALILFKQLKVMHKLPRYYVKPLRIASFMYDAGKSINAEDYTKYSKEKIIYAGINGATHREILIAGFIAVCQNPDDFSLNEWIKYKDLLTDEDLDAVRKLGVIVKLAVALNASRKAIIQDIVCDILGDSIIMKTVTDGDASFEILEGMKVAQDYKKVYKKSLQII